MNMVQGVYLIDHLMVFRSVRLTANISLGWKWLIPTKAVAYNGAIFITTIKGFKVHATRVDTVKNRSLSLVVPLAKLECL